MLNINLLGLWVLRLILCSGAVIAVLLGDYGAALILGGAFFASIVWLDVENL